MLRPLHLFLWPLHMALAPLLVALAQSLAPRKMLLFSRLSSSEFHSFFGRIKDIINCFRDLLTFNRDKSILVTPFENSTSCANLKIGELRKIYYFVHDCTAKIAAHFRSFSSDRTMVQLPSSWALQ